MVIAIGQDGLVANTLKYLDNQMLIGVNPDPARWDGVLLPFSVNGLAGVVTDVFKNKRMIKEVTMAKATLNDGQVLYGVNDLFIGQKTHISARYRIHDGKKSEYHSSSGIIVSTGLGSTGWLKSIVTGAKNITNAAYKMTDNYMEFDRIPWNAQYLYYSVREPFLSKATQARLTFGKITPEKPLKVLSQMSENGVIFSDGVESDFLNFNSGIEAAISLAEKKGRLVVYNE